MLFFLIVLFFFSVQPVMGQMHYLDKYEGIPIVAVYTNRDAQDLNEGNFERLRELGAIGILSRIHDNYEYNLIYNQGLRVIPYNDWGAAPNWVTYYCDAVYTKWEAEGNMGNISDGEVELKHHSNGSIVNDNGIYALKTNTSNPGELIYGPAYYEYVKYKLLPLDTSGYVTYTANYHLKIKQTGNLPSGYLDDPVCTIKVVAANPKVSPVRYKTIDSTVLIVRDFIEGQGNGWNIWENKSLADYTLEGLVEGNKKEINGPGDNFCADTTFDSGWMEFKVDWAGRSYLDLYMDYVEVSDLKGRLLKTNPAIAEQIKTLVSSYSDTSHVLGWGGLNEPSTLDSFEPIRIIDSLVYDTSNQNLHIYQTFTSGWMGLIGYFEPGYIPENGWVIKSLELMKRTKLPYLSYNIYCYDFPYTLHDTPDYEDLNIDYVIRDLHQIDSAGIPFAFSTQSGKFYHYEDTSCKDADTNYHNPTPAQLLYHINLGAMYGMKELTMDPFFTWDQDDPEQICYGSRIRDGLVDGYNNTLTELGQTWKEKVTPRMSGLFGKALKQIHPTAQFHKLELPVLASYNQYLSYIDYHENGPSSKYIDLGFFTRGDEDYFMVLPRWYSGGAPGDSLVIGIDKANQGYNNWNVTNFIDSTTKTIVREGFVKMPHTAGDARLFKVYPVVKDGGSLDTNETISNSTTLQNDLTIEDGVTLTINATYECYANIYINGSGQLKTVNGGTINFHNGKGIIAKGNPHIGGTLANKLTLDFGSTTSGSGIQIQPDTYFIMDYCTLKNAHNLVSCNSHQFQTVISYCNFENSGSYAVSLSGSSFRTPSINHCAFLSTADGIFSAGQSSITISDNSFVNNQLAISLSQIPNVQILNNYINSNIGSMPGIFLNSSGGTIRSNLIIGHSLGLSLANASPLVGNNEIYGNKINGIYVGSGSVPDLRGALVGNPPDQYAISGYNEIMNNGGYNITRGQQVNDDGSEIYFSSGANILLSRGCNLISDDRIPSPPLQTTIYLMNGSINTKSIDAIYNAWGDTVYAGRFGRLKVTFNPHYYERCPIDSGGKSLVIKDNEGIPLDTVYSNGEPSYPVNDIDLSYSEADENLINRQYSPADNIFNSIITSSPSDTTSQPAYLGLYKSKRLQNADSTTLAVLRNLYNTNLPEITDSVMRKVLGQLSLLTLVDQKQYNEAIDGFADIINQNPETEEAMFAEIDAMTTSLLAQNGNDSTLGKSLNKRLLVKGPVDMQSRLNDLIKSRFGIEENKGNKVIPTKYFLYNNYPNPFNPTTTIRLDIPERTNIELSVYNILGQKVKTLIANETKDPGRYEVSFNGNSLASGVYVYRLITRNYSQSKKMLLIK